MAYHEFQNEKIYEAPQIDVMPKTLSVMQHLNDQKERQRILQQQKAQQDWEDIKAFHGNTTIPKYDRLIQGEAENITKNAQKDILQYGFITPKTKLQMQKLENLNARGSAIREERKRQLEIEHSKAAADKYYDPTININRINEGIPYRGLSLEEELNADENSLVDNRAGIGHPQDIRQTFKHGAHLGDWMQTFKDKSKEQSYTGMNGAKSSSLMTSPFVNKYGVPDVTNEHVSEYLSSHPSVKPYYTDMAIEQIQKEIEETKAHDPNWMKGMSDADILSGIIDGQIKNPHPNAVGQTRDANNNPVNKPLDLNERIREMARNDIKSHAHVLEKIDTDLSNSTNGSGWGITNKNMQVAEGFENKNFSSPSVAIVNPKSPTNPYLRMSVASNIRYNLDNGSVVTNKLPREFVLNGGIQMVPVKADGTPVDIQAATPEELAQKIKELPASAFGPGGIVGTKIALRGQSINKKQALDMAYAKIADLKKELTDDPNNPVIKEKLSALDQVLGQINAGTELSPELMQKFLGADVIHNEIVPVDPNDSNVQQIKGMTGMDVYSPKVLEHFGPLKSAIDQRIKQSKEIERPAVKEFWENNPKELEKIKKTKAPISAESFNEKWKTLKSGEKLIGPDGKEYTKK